MVRGSQPVSNLLLPMIDCVAKFASRTRQSLAPGPRGMDCAACGTEMYLPQTDFMT